MKKLQRLLIDILIIFGLMSGLLVTTGCSMYNHNRIKDKMATSYLQAYGNEVHMQCLDAGIRPSDAVRIQVIKGPEENGFQASVAFNLLNTTGIKSYFQTFKEEPISSVFSLAVDAAISYYAVEGVRRLTEDDDEPSQDMPNEVTIINNVTIDNLDNINTTTGTGDRSDDSIVNVNVTVINNFGDTNYK